MGDERDDELMRRAIALARAARRHTAPWPSVGCVLVSAGGEIVGEGATGPYPTGPHAEVAALRVAGERARGATAYCTLEPCNHHGNTPPCTDALIDAGVARVVVAVGDPDERVAGRGYARLRDAHVDVLTGVGTDEAERDLAPYLHHRRTGRAFVVAKLALSLDGRVAAADGSSQWITSPEARADAHELRADSQAIVVGAGTARADRPTLTVRDVAVAPARSPLRVVLDARGRVPADGPLFDLDLAPTFVVTTEAARPGAVDAWRAAGAKVEVVAPGAGGRGVDLDATFALLGREGVLQALVEGGGQLIGAIVEGGHAERVVAYVAPVLLGVDGVPGFALPGPRSIDDAIRWNIAAVARVGDDVRLELEPRTETR
ncbi:MAG TPA: bifunctional diaminohydroxyphosphoribosylaminopyrimidine deaminase/5-amino-6-(5-phosphoribosylamino)uracil reductase RibD [Acidimicrobiia bacterium]|nr:bifunctional diaminohydroxyphosphoribosylaminopyrimidine deaminase/5-amino-6-(5-phosphoribosylamino)uracil reductase RibD [Acidimicrobiia bacterium]